MPKDVHLLAHIGLLTLFENVRKRPLAYDS
jgi:hypothetical protein